MMMSTAALFIKMCIVSGTNYDTVTNFGNIFYRQTSNATLLQRARDQLHTTWKGRAGIMGYTVVVVHVMLHYLSVVTADVNATIHYCCRQTHSRL